jgi:hypothetical protein
MELNEDDRERLLAFDRWKWQMDQAGLKREGYREGQEAAEAKYWPALEAKDREIEQLRQKLREAGIDD